MSPRPIFRINTQGNFATTSILGGFEVDDGAVSYDYTTGTTSIDSLELGALSFPPDAGIVSWVDMPVYTNATNTIMSYSAQIDGTDILTVRADSAGSGFIGTTTVGIGTSTPAWKLQVASATSTTKAFLAISDNNARANFKHWTISSQGGNLFFATSTDLYATSTVPALVASSSGAFGIGSTTPSATSSLSLVAGLRLQLLLSAATQAVCFDSNANGGGNGALLVDCGGGTPADYAEYYPTETELEPGDIVVPSKTIVQTVGGRTAKLARATEPYQRSLLGVISDPARATDFNVIGVNDVANEDNPLPVALNGRLPVKISTEGGSIKIGDRITSSSLAGIGMKATQSGVTLGFALEDFDEESATTTAVIDGKEVKTGKVMVFINLGYHKIDSEVMQLAGEVGLPGGSPTSITNAWSVDQTNGKVNVGFFGNINLHGNSILDVASILSSNGKWKIGEDGRIVAEEIEVKRAKVEESLDVGTAAKPTGITIYDSATGEPYCIKVVNGAMQSVAGRCSAQEVGLPALEETPVVEEVGLPLGSPTSGTQEVKPPVEGSTSEASESVEATSTPEVALPPESVEEASSTPSASSELPPAT